MALHCPRCDKAIPEDAVVCPYCKTPIRIARQVEVKKSGSPLIAGILEILSASICLIVGILGLVSFMPYYNYYYYSYYWLLIMGVFGVIGFIFGLTGGILAFKRTDFAIVVLGASTTMLSGLISIIALAMVSYATLPYQVLIFGFLGVPIIVLSTLTLIFVAISRAEFT
jgi:hypothetical protein